MPIKILIYFLIFSSTPLLSFSCRADEPLEEKGEDREPASQSAHSRRSHIHPAPLDPSAHPKTAVPPPPVYIPVPVYVQAPPSPPKKSPPLIGLVIDGIVGFDLASCGNADSGAPGYGLTVGYAATPVWTLGVSAIIVDQTPDDLGTTSGATAMLNQFTAMVDYHFPGLESMYIGFRGGIALRTGSFSSPLAGTSTVIAPALGGIVGWNFQILDAMGLSPQVGVMRIATTVPITDIQLQFGIKYWPFR